MSFKCNKCEKAFPKNQGLQKHLARKTSCSPIIDLEGTTDKNTPNKCRYCNRTFSRSDNLARHLKSCKIANSDDGMEKLMAHTLQRQLTEQRQNTAKLQEQVAELTSLLKSQMTVGGLPSALAPTPTSITIQGTGTVNTGTVNNIVQNILIMPWDGERCIDVKPASVTEAFAQNERLQDFVRLSSDEMNDAEVVPPYVTELFVDLTRRTHADPSARNVYLSPKRADQALVYLKSGTWEVRQFDEAVDMLLKGVAKFIQRLNYDNEERCKFSLDTQNALAMARGYYECATDEYLKRAKGPMAAHLTNMMPPSEKPGKAKAALC